MKVTVEKETNAPANAEVQVVHPLKKSYMFVSKRHVDYDSLTAFEAFSLAVIFIGSITTGVVMSAVS